MMHRHVGKLPPCDARMKITHKKITLFFEVNLLCINFACPKKYVLDI